MHPAPSIRPTPRLKSNFGLCIGCIFISPLFEPYWHRAAHARFGERIRPHARRYCNRQLRQKKGYLSKGPLCRSASQHLRRSGERLCAQFSRCVDLEPEDCADEQKGRHWYKGGVITAEAVDEVPVCHSREQTSHLGRCVHQPDHRPRMPSSDIQANAETARRLEGTPPIGKREQLDREDLIRCYDDSDRKE